LFDDGTASRAQPRVDFLQLVLIFDLNAEMIETGLTATRRDREINARVFEHPFGIIGFDDLRLRGEQRRIETDRMR
jgi:hypothetical protein